MKQSLFVLAFALSANLFVGCAATSKKAEHRLSPSVTPVKKNIASAQKANDRLLEKLNSSSARTQRLRDKIIILLERHRT